MERFLVTTRLLVELRVKAREQGGREGDPSAGIIDSQSVPMRVGQPVGDSGSHPV
jgi:hypothetical protein